MAAARKKRRVREVQLGFEAISIEGGLLSPEWLSRIAQLTAGVQSEADYRIKKGLNLRDEIGRYWRIAQAHWSEFMAGHTAGADSRALAVRFFESLLRDSFDFTSLVKTEPVVIAERSYPVGLSALNGRVPVVVAPATSGLDVLATAFGDGTRRRSAFGLAQEFLNAQGGSLWGLACDGVTLRIVRDNASLTRPAWIEADLQRIFTEERYADFAALWLLMHETRFGHGDQPATECALEAWRNAGLQDGTVARERLRDGVKDALLALGQGFLAHPDNQALRAGLRGGSLSTKDYFSQLLRLVYRLIFLLTVEERGLLHAQDANEESKALYASGYSLRRLRDRSVKRSAHDRFSDLWDSVKVVLRGVAAGEQRLGLPALAGIFAGGQCPDLDSAKLENRGLLFAVFKLAWLREDDSLVRVNWRDMGPEELGSVYESLLELVPQIPTDGRLFTFATGADAKGNARKTTGSYYTPDSLVQVLLNSALEPVIADTISKNPEKSIEALLGLSIVDPACGSGHFLLAAARRLASHVARIRANGTPSAADYRHALRQVVGRCIYGVDLNPMAVELCKVSLWMEAVEPGLPLTFLNSHIQHGNALFGTTPELMAEGIPDAAWDAIESDDKKIASMLKKRNKAEAGGQRTLTFTTDTNAESLVISLAVQELDAAPDIDVMALEKKESRWEDILESPAYGHQRFVANAWCAAFMWRKTSGESADAAPTNGVWRQIRDNAAPIPAVTARVVAEISEQYACFHWWLQFPQVFAKGGFDLVIGNPPWELLEDKTAEGVSSISAAEQHWYRTGYYAVLGGRRDYYKLFLVVATHLIRRNGRFAFITPLGCFLEEESAKLRKELFDTNSVRLLRHFQNAGKRFFSHVHASYRFCVVVCERSDSSDHAFTTVADDPKRIGSQLPIDVRRADFDLLLGKSRAATVYSDPQYAGLHQVVMRRIARLQQARFRVVAEFHGSTDKTLMSDAPSQDSWVVLKNRNIHLFIPEYSPPEAWISLAHVAERMTRKGLQDRRWLTEWPRLVFRDIARSDDERTLIACLVPPGYISTYDTPMLVPDVNADCVGREVVYLTGLTSSFMCDFMIRPFVDKHIKPYTLSRIPWPGHGNVQLPIANLIYSTVLELTYTTSALREFANSLGWSGLPFSTSPDRRFLLRCELDAAFFHLYGLSREETDYVMDTFSIVRKNDEKTHGEYRTKRTILEIYDAMAEAARTGKPYETRLDPPPVDLCVAHPTRAGVVVPFPGQTPGAKELLPWGDAIVADAASRAQVGLDPGVWSTTWRGEALGTAALAAVLRHVERPTPRSDVERAVVLTVLPRLMLSNLKGDCGKQWRNAIGSSNLAIDSIGSLAIPWSVVLRSAIQQGVLVEDGNSNWTPGPDVGDAPSAALDARAIVVLSWLATTPAESSEISSQVVALRAA